MTVKELQEQAKKLGISYRNLTKEELEKALTDAKQEVSEEKVSNVEKRERYDLALVKRGQFTVRTYSLRQHGEKFEDLARQYAEHRKYDVKLQREDQGIKCPKCGHRFIHE